MIIIIFRFIVESLQGSSGANIQIQRDQIQLKNQLVPLYSSRAVNFIRRHKNDFQLQKFRQQKSEWWCFFFFLFFFFFSSL